MRLSLIEQSLVIAVRKDDQGYKFYDMDTLSKSVSECRLKLEVDSNINPHWDKKYPVDGIQVITMSPIEIRDPTEEEMQANPIDHPGNH